MQGKFVLAQKKIIHRRDAETQSNRRAINE